MGGWHHASHGVQHCLAPEVRWDISRGRREQVQVKQTSKRHMNAFRSSNRKELPAEIVCYDGWVLLLTRNIFMPRHTHLGCIAGHKNAVGVFAETMEYCLQIEYVSGNSCGARTFGIDKQVVLGLMLIQTA
jgi:hypothetical protein